MVSAADAAILAETYRRLTDDLAAASGGAPAGGAMANSNAAPSRPVANESADGYHYEEEPF